MISLSFFKIVHDDIVHDDSWQWYLATDQSRFLIKKFGGLNLGQMGQNWNEN